MKTNDFIKFLTQQFVKYVNQSKDDRKKEKNIRKEQKKKYSSHLFGLIPFSLMMLFKRKS